MGSSAWPRVAVVGCGYWGKNLVRNFAELGVLAALVDSKPARAEELAERHGGSVRSYRDVLADGAIGAIVVSTPGPAHYRNALAALDAGKHVYVEKPLTMSVAESEALVARAAAARRTLMVGHILLHHPAFVHLRRLVAEGAVGRVRYVTSTRFNLGKILTDEDVLWSLGPHDLSMVAALLGPEPDTIAAHGEALLRPGVADVATLHLAYPGGVRADIRLSWISPVKEHRLIVHGERGVLIFDDTKPWEEKLTLARIDLDWADPPVYPGKGSLEPIALDVHEPLKIECRHFLDAVATGREPLTDGAEGLRVTRLLDRAARSMADGGRPA